MAQISSRFGSLSISKELRRKEYSNSVSTSMIPHVLTSLYVDRPQPISQRLVSHPAPWPGQPRPAISTKEITEVATIEFDEIQPPHRLRPLGARPDI
jgi:hypothetical protein